ncbi:MAG TPA: protoglobin domain-containing protein, partial [Halococcus sp.]|nr:protoglobin domain-containing protein [Halococcus sp.]
MSSFSPPEFYIGENITYRSCMSGEIPGYDFGNESVPDAPITMKEFNRLQKTVGWSTEDDEYLQLAGEILEPQVDEMLDRWLEFIADFEFLTDYRRNVDTGEVIEEYGARSRKRYGQWIRDTCDTPYSEEWLKYQFEIGRRHHRSRKNQVDDVNAAPHIHLRYIIPLVYLHTTT